MPFQVPFKIRDSWTINLTTRKPEEMSRSAYKKHAKRQGAELLCYAPEFPQVPGRAPPPVGAEAHAFQPVEKALKAVVFRIPK